MGDIEESCQVLILIGKFAYQAGSILCKTALASSQVMGMIYMSKWKGKSSYKRLLNVKGEENGLLFVNIGLEKDSRKNAARIRGIEKELKKYGIMFARLPDLCGGDGNTQICISARDAKKLEAMMRTHMNGKYKDVPVMEISQVDYTQTGKRADGTNTPEMDILQSRVKRKRDPPFREERIAERETPSAARADDSAREGRRVVSFRKNELPEEIRVNARDLGADPEKKKKSAKPYHKGDHFRKHAFPETGDRLLMEIHDLEQTVGKDGYTWLKTEPVITRKIEDKIYHVLSLPDGKNGIIVPNDKYWYNGNSYTGGNIADQPYGALLAEDRQYYCVNFKDGKVGTMTGKDAVRAARETPVKEYAKELEKLLKNEKSRIHFGKTVDSAIKKSTAIKK